MAQKNKLETHLENIENKLGSDSKMPLGTVDPLDWHLTKIESLISGGGGEDERLPDPTQGDEGKVATVKSDLSGFEYKEKADLVNGKVPESQLPSYVDDVLEYDDSAHFPAEGEEGKIYVAKDTGNTYRWSGSEYIQVGGQEIPVTDVQVDGESVLDGTIAKISLPNPELTENILWADLKTKRDNAQLEPGKFYRITNYECTTIQQNTSSAGHQFDLVLQAITEDTLSPDALAVKHAGDTYFEKCDLSKWKIKYSLDNYLDRYWWAKTERIYFNNQWYSYSIERSEPNAEYPYAWVQYRSTTKFFSNTPRPQVNDIVYQNSDGTGTSYTITNIDYNVGTGVIYYMVDEHENCCEYDFKNILFFTNKMNDGYTFRWKYYSQTQDASVSKNPGYKLWIAEHNSIRNQYDAEYGWILPEIVLSTNGLYAGIINNEILNSHKIFIATSGYSIKYNYIRNCWNINTTNYSYFSTTFSNNTFIDVRSSFNNGSNLPQMEYNYLDNINNLNIDTYNISYIWKCYMHVLDKVYLTPSNTNNHYLLNSKFEFLEYSNQKTISCMTISSAWDYYGKSWSYKPTNSDEILID